MGSIGSSIGSGSCLIDDKPAVKMRRSVLARYVKLVSYCVTIFGSMAALGQSTSDQYPREAVCIIDSGADVPSAAFMSELPTGEVLVGSPEGLFVARNIGGKVGVKSVGDTGAVYTTMPHLSIGEILVGAEKGLFLVREVGDKIRVELATEVDTGRVHGRMHDVPGLGMLLRADKGWFIASEEGGKINVAPVGDPNTAEVSDFHNTSPGAVLVGAKNGLFLVDRQGGNVRIKPAGDTNTGSVYDIHDFPIGRLLISAANGLFLARDVGHKFDLETADFGIGRVIDVFDFPANRLLIRSDRGWFFAYEVNGNLSAIPFGNGTDIGRISQVYQYPTGEVFIAAEKGLFVTTGSANELHSVWNRPTSDIHIFPSGDALVGGEDLLFIEREQGGKFKDPTIFNVNNGSVRFMRELPGGDVLIGALGGSWLLAREIGHQLSVAPVVSPDLGTVFAVNKSPSGTGNLISSMSGLFIEVTNPLSLAQVNLLNRENLDGSQIDPKREQYLAFTISHECAPLADRFGLRVRVVAPGERPPGRLEEHIAEITPGAAISKVAIVSTFSKPGAWSFQVVATFGGVERTVGKSQILTFVEGPWWERWWKLLTIGFGLIIAIVNLVLFGLARRSPWAWRVATDDGWGTWTLRVATLALSHLSWAQLWILDLYFQRYRKRIQEPRPFLPLPLTGGTATVPTANALAPPWKGKRIWVQGPSGMGKTAVFRHFTEEHFRVSETAFAAYAQWGCIVVPFAARDFASSGEDKDDPAWVVDAVRATLSSDGLTFTSSTLLSRFFESGTIGVAIDGLNEVERTRAISAFSRAFSEAPMLITSQQQPPNDRFATWRLPADIREFTSDLLRLYLPAEDAEVLKERIEKSGLRDAIQSGYDVRLVIDLARTDHQHTNLPSDRKELYAAVINAGWPEVTDNTRREQQSLLAAAAWRMVSERKPNEDMRRLKPDVDLPANLLSALADARTSDNRPVRLVRRVGGGAFEFVHDQMHAYLAARWFAQDGLSPAELEKMVEGSTIWMQTPDARRTLWGFVAALLDDNGLVELWKRIKDNDEWDVLERALAAEGERRGLIEPRKPKARKRKAS